jgi:ribosomal protein S20
MDESAISSNSYLQNIASSSLQQTSGANVRSAFKDLAQALQSGDLQGAQQAFATIQSARNARTNATQTTNGGNSTIQDAFNSLGQALQSGDLQGAQQAFNTLQSTFAAHRGGHHHHHASGADPDKGTGSAAGTTSSTGTTGTNGVTDASTLFSALLQQAAAGGSTGTNGVPDISTLLNTLLQQSTKGSGVVSGSSSNQSTINIVA